MPRDVTNCLSCGRDTRSPYGICGRCSGKKVCRRHDESRGRKVRRAPESEVETWYSLGEDWEPSDSNYHGDTSRDDL